MGIKKALHRGLLMNLINSSALHHDHDHDLNDLQLLQQLNQLLAVESASAAVESVWCLLLELPLQQLQLLLLEQLQQLLLLEQHTQQTEQKWQYINFFMCLIIKICKLSFKLNYFEIRKRFKQLYATLSWYLFLDRNELIHFIWIRIG